MKIYELVTRGHCVFDYDMTGFGESEENASNGFLQFFIEVLSTIQLLRLQL